MSELCPMARIQQTFTLCSKLSHLTAERRDLGGRSSFQEINLLMVMAGGRRKEGKLLYPGVLKLAN